MKHITTFTDFVSESLNEGNFDAGSFAADLNDHISDMYNFVTKAKGKASTQQEKKALADIIAKIDRFDSEVNDLADSLMESENIDEAVNIDDSKYVRAHGKKPKGNGMWGFEIKGEEVFTPTAMSYADAQKWAKEEAKRLGATYVYTLG